MILYILVRLLHLGDKKSAQKLIKKINFIENKTNNFKLDILNIIIKTGMIKDPKSRASIFLIHKLLKTANKENYKVKISEFEESLNKLILFEN